MIGGESLVAEPGVAAIAGIRQGYSWSLAHRMQSDLALNDDQFAEFLGLSSRTLARRRKSAGALDKIASDRLYRIMRIVQLAASVLESREAGLSWLKRPQFGLGGAVPLALLDTEPGFEAVERLLLQIEYGSIS